MKLRRGKIFKIALVVAIAALLVGASSLLDEVSWIIQYLGHARATPPATLNEALPPCPGCNLLFISLDTLRANRLDFLGGMDKLTPNLDKIAAQSVVFTNAFTNAFFTTPSHMTMFTSLFPNSHRVEGRDIKLFRSPRNNLEGHVLDKKYQTLAEILKSKGYKTYWNAPLRLNFLDLHDGFERGFDEFHPSPFDRGFDFGPDRDPPFVTSSLNPLVRNSGKSFLFFHSYITHQPYVWRGEPPPRSLLPYTKATLLSLFKDSVISGASTLPHALATPGSIADEVKLGEACTDFNDMSLCFSKFSSADRFWHAVGQVQARRTSSFINEERRGEEERARELVIYRRAYDRGVVFLDQQIGEMWRALETSGALDHTLVVIVSDHGEELFDSGEPGHSSFFEHTARIPILIYHPKLKKGFVVPQLVSLVDMMPTILAILQIEPPAQTQGRMPWKNPSPYVFGYALGNEYVRGWSWKLIRTYDGKEQLYYLPLDPGEKNNLIEYKNPWVTAAYRELAQARANWRLDQSLGQ